MTPKDLLTECDDLIADVIEFLLNDEPEIDGPDPEDEAPSDDRGGER